MNSTYGETPRRRYIEAPISELYQSWILKQWENSLQYPYFDMRQGWSFESVYRPVVYKEVKRSFSMVENCIP